MAVVRTWTTRIGQHTSTWWSVSKVKGRTAAECQSIGTQKGLVTFFPKDREVLIDLDEPFATTCVKTQAKIATGIGKLLADHGLESISQLYTVSQSGNAHLYLLMNDDITIIERCLVSALLGGDLQREAFNLIRFRGGEADGAICLFETPEQAKLVREWRMTYSVRLAKERIQHAKDMIASKSILPRIYSATLEDTYIDSRP